VRTRERLSGVANGLTLVQARSVRHDGKLAIWNGGCRI
jgi:hypothetical protein